VYTGFSTVSYTCFVTVVCCFQQELKDLSATKGQLAAELSEANGKIHVGLV